MYANSSITLFKAHSVNIISLYLPQYYYIVIGIKRTYRYTPRHVIVCIEYEDRHFQLYSLHQTNFASTSKNKIKFIQKYISLLRGESLRRRWDTMTFKFRFGFPLWCFICFIVSLIINPNRGHQLWRISRGKINVRLRGNVYSAPTRVRSNGGKF